MIATVIVLAKAPHPGRVKTRLVPPLTYEEAAFVAEAALHDTLRVASEVPAAAHVLALDGDVGSLRPSGWRVVAQPAGTLDRRIAAAFGSARPDGPAVLIGMDTPQLQAAQLSEFDPSCFDACLGPAADGGYWAIGLREPSFAPHVVLDVPMSTDRTGPEQLRRLVAAGQRVQLLDMIADVDTIEVARDVAARAPDSRFAAAMQAFDVVARC